MKYPFLDLAIVNEPYFDDMIEAMAHVCRTGRYVGGDECTALEDGMIYLTKAPYAVGVSNGLDALRLILMAWKVLGRINDGDEVIVPANTYVASVLAIIDAGLVPVLAEPDPRTLNLDTLRLGEYLTERTRAIMPVHLYGRVCWDDALADFARAHHLLVIEDVAQAIGACSATPGLYGTHQAGSLGHAGAFSFYPTKNLGAMGDAGAVVTHDSEVADAVRALANYGSDRRYHNIYVGYNCRLDPVQAAVLNAKFPGLTAENERRRVLAKIYSTEIHNPLITLPTAAGDDHVWHQYVIRCDERDRLRAYLYDNEVGTDIHYATPPHRQPALAHIAHGPLPVTEAIADTVLSLPISACTSPDDAHEIANILNQFI